MFRLDNIEFEIDNEESIFYVEDQDEGINFALDIGCKSAGYEGEVLRPSLCINFFETKVKNVNELIGLKVTIANIEEADEREDTMYLYEHEPFVKYTLKIIDAADNKVHIACEGIAVTDGYANPYKAAPFELDAWVQLKKI